MKYLLISALLLPALASAQALKTSALAQRQGSKGAVIQPTLQQIFATHLLKFQNDGTEDPDGRKIVYGDIDGDGVQDAVVLYTLDNKTGNSWSQCLAVFLNKKGGYKLAADEVVGGKYFRDFKVAKIIGRSIIGQTQTCPDGSPQVCANPLKKRVKLVLLGAKLREQ